MKLRYAAEFKRAFRAIVQSLPVRQRVMLRLYFLEGLGNEAIAVLYEVHPSTVGKWLARIRQDLLEATRRELVTRLGLGSSELDSVMGLIMSRLDASIDTMLRTPA